jgi:type I restriction enzyme, S subunit
MQLLNYFHELTLHPANARQLKALILQMAVQGKLTAEWRKAHPDVEPAQKQLDQIENKKGDYVNNIKASAGIGSSNDLFNIPKTWHWCKLEDVGKVGSSSRVHKKEWMTTGVPFYRAREVVKLSKFGFVNNELFITEEKYHELIKKGNIPEKDDIMLTGVGTIGVPYIVKADDKFYFKDASVLIFKNIYKLNPNYLYFYFNSSYWQELIHKDSMGTTVHTLTISRANDANIPLPPLEEQKAIVEIVDRLFKEVEQLEQLTESRIRLKEQFAVSALRDLTTNNTPQEWEVIRPHFHTFFNTEANIKKLRETILQLAVQGKLTASWRETHSPFEGGAGNPDDHDAALLLEKIKAEKARLIAEGKIKKEKPLPEITEEEIPYELPEGWVWCRLGDVGLTQTGATPPKNNSSFFGDYIPFVGPGHLNSSGINYPEAGLSKEGLAKGRLIPSYSLIMVCIGGSIGKCQVNEIDISCNQQLNTITPYIISVDMVRIICQSPYFQKSVVEKSTGSATPIINKGKWERIVFPLAPYFEQEAIITAVNRLMALCDALEQETTQSKTQTERWMRGVVREVIET